MGFERNDSVKCEEDVVEEIGVKYKEETVEEDTAEGHADDTGLEGHADDACLEVLAVDAVGAEWLKLTSDSLSMFSR